MTTVRQQLREFFIRNPDEELTSKDIRTKFDCCKATAQAAISRLTRDGFLDRRDEFPVVFYFPKARA